MIGPPFEVSFPTLGIPVDDIERVVLAYRDRYEDIGLFENTVYPGIAEMLDELAAAGPHAVDRHRQARTDGAADHRPLRLRRLLRGPGRSDRRGRHAADGPRPR